MVANSPLRPSAIVIMVGTCAGIGLGGSRSPLPLPILLAAAFSRSGASHAGLGEASANREPSCPVCSSDDISERWEWGQEAIDRLLNQLWRRAGNFTVGVRTASGQGSGIVYDILRNSSDKSLKYIVATNHHLTQSHSEATLKVDGRDLEASVAFRDPDADVAFLVHVSAKERPLPLETARRCDTTAFPGQSVVAFGFPLDFELTMALGHVTGPGDRGSRPNVPREVQSDVGLVDGHSGGPFVDRRGCLLGMNRRERRKSSSSTGVHLAVSAEALDHAYKAMISGGVRRASLRVEAGADPRRTAILKDVLREGIRARAWLVRGGIVQAHPWTVDGQRAPRPTTAEILGVNPGRVVVSGAVGEHGEPCNGNYTTAGQHSSRPLYRNSNNASIFFFRGKWHIDDEGTTDVRKAVFVIESNSDWPPEGLWKSRLRGVDQGPSVSIIDAGARLRFADKLGLVEQDQDLPQHMIDLAATSEIAAEEAIAEASDLLEGLIVSKSYGLMVSEANMRTGLRVRRGADWEWGDQDGFEGAPGNVTSIAPDREKGWCRVAWEASGHTNNYRVGAGGSYDLELEDPTDRLAVLWPLDIITHIDNKRVLNTSQVYEALEGNAPGMLVNVTFTSLGRWKYLNRPLEILRKSEDTDAGGASLSALAALALARDRGQSDAGLLAALLAAQGRRTPPSVNFDDADPYGEDVQLLLKEGLGRASFSVQMVLHEVDTKAGTAKRSRGDEYVFSV